LGLATGFLLCTKLGFYWGVAIGSLINDIGCCLGKVLDDMNEEVMNDVLHLYVYIYVTDDSDQTPHIFVCLKHYAYNSSNQSGWLVIKSRS
jgi:hypothetical protein